jgi:hypothetical protein
MFNRSSNSNAGGIAILAIPNAVEFFSPVAVLSNLEEVSSTRSDVTLGRILF